MISSSTSIDVRTPAEFAKGHIPNAINLPLFSDEERAKVGTCYKQVGQKEAFVMGLEFAGPKLAQFVKKAEEWKGELSIYCWRGGMRSKAMVWLLKMAGLECEQVEGGYKAFRKWVLKILERPYQFKVVTGLTGSGKTEYLHHLEKEGEQVLDLEKLANHYGSTFGMLGQPPQPSNEQFENLIATTLAQFEGPVFVEDESRMIGGCKVPDGVYTSMKRGERVVLKCPREERVNRLVKVYGHYPKKRFDRSDIPP
ncbi:MAG: tRNA 2-selenouridine synthase [Chlamydiales bacterium]|nr:tRNA 2-selenouridine synthase [Chlamydiales bacterium]MCH9619416.1 tRNA 2-selenouridine synthase [Chlamydiales bacterium]MCH9622220.1 tRNA 2-selenouridine synthase [Chlamydiales bacterium]